MLGHSHPASVVSEQVSDLIDAEIAQRAQQNPFGLIIGEGTGNQVHGVLRREFVDGHLLSRGRIAIVDIGSGVGASARCRAARIDHS